MERHLGTVAHMSTEFDAIVIGSGITGGFAAKELTERGLKVLMIERGPMIEHGAGYINETKAPWEMPFRGFGNQRLMREEYFIQKNFPIDEWTMRHFVNDKENPYQTSEESPFQWVRGYQLGGRSLTWGHQSYRWSDYEFGANAKDGHGVDWPVRYRDLAPWYDYVEDFIGVAGSREGLPQLPDGIFQPAMPMPAGEQLLARKVAERYSDRRVIPGRTATLTQAKEGRAACQYRFICPRGCSYGAYFSTQSSTLPAARKTGRLTLLTDTIVTSIEYDSTAQRVVAVHTLDANTRATSRRTARIIFVNAGAINSVALLLRSHCPQFPNGLANKSGTLGHYIMDHAFTAAGISTIPGLEDRIYYGNRPSNYIIPRFQNLETSNPSFLRGYNFQGASFRANWKRGAEQAGTGAPLQAELQTPGEWRIMMGVFAECLPRFENRVSLSNQTDRWGMQQIDIRMSFGENERALLHDAQREAKQMLALLGGTLLFSNGEPNLPGSAIHEMGGARMGHDPKTSVANGLCQTHDIPNLFLTDGAIMSSSGSQSPSLTYMAFTARAAADAVKMMQEGKI